MNFWSYLREEDMGKEFLKEHLTGSTVEYTKSRHIQFTLLDGRIVLLGTGEDHYRFGEIESISRTPEDEDDPILVKSFYLKTENGKIIIPHQRSDIPQTGYVLHPAFVKQPVDDLSEV